MARQLRGFLPVLNGKGPILVWVLLYSAQSEESYQRFQRRLCLVYAAVLANVTEEK